MLMRDVLKGGSIVHIMVLEYCLRSKRSMSSN